MDGIRGERFATDAEILEGVDQSLKETREVMMMRELRQSCDQLIQHLENLGYLAGSEAPEMMSDAWGRVFFDFQRVQDAELAMAERKRLGEKEDERRARETERMASAIDMIDVQSIIDAQEPKVEDTYAENVMKSFDDLSEDMADSEQVWQDMIREDPPK